VSADDSPGTSTARPEASRPTLDTAVRRRRADLDFFLRLREAMDQNRRALERLGR
jgi:hypothetical protein